MWKREGNHANTPDENHIFRAAGGGEEEEGGGGEANLDTDLLRPAAFKHTLIWGS